MKATVVRYQAKPERADENQTLVEKVFADLEARQPDGFTYKRSVLRGRLAGVKMGVGSPCRRRLFPGLRSRL